MADNKTRAPRGGHGPNAHGYQRPKDMKGTFQKLMGYVGKYKASLVLAHKIAQFFNTSIEDVFLFEEEENL